MLVTPDLNLSNIDKYNINQSSKQEMVKKVTNSEINKAIIIEINKTKNPKAIIKNKNYSGLEYYNKEVIKMRKQIEEEKKNGELKNWIEPITPPLLKLE